MRGQRRTAVWGSLHTLKDLKVKGRYVPFPRQPSASCLNQLETTKLRRRNSQQHDRADRAAAFTSRQLIASTIIANHRSRLCTYGIPISKSKTTNNQFRPSTPPTTQPRRHIHIAANMTSTIGIPIKLLNEAQVSKHQTNCLVQTNLCSCQKLTKLLLSNRVILSPSRSPPARHTVASLLRVH